MSDLSVILGIETSHPVRTGLLIFNTKNASTSNILNQKHDFIDELYLNIDFFSPTIIFLIAIICSIKCSNVSFSRNTRFFEIIN